MGLGVVEVIGVIIVVGTIYTYFNYNLLATFTLSLLSYFSISNSALSRASFVIILPFLLIDLI